MTYEKKTWASKEIINVEELQHMEEGIVEAHLLITNVENQLNALPDYNLLMQIANYDPDVDNKVESSDVADSLKDTTSVKTYSDIASEIDSDIITHKNDASAHHARYTDAEAQIAINSDTDHGSTAQHNYRTDEEIRDLAASILIAGTGVAVTVDDEADIVTVGLSDNAFTGVYKSKLDGIEVNATADMTGSEIITAINASGSKINTDNLTLPEDTFTDAYKTKLDGIEAQATTDMTGSEIVAAINASTAVINPVNTDRGNLSTVIERGFIGEVSSGDTLRIYNPRAGVIQSVTLISETQPVGESLMVDVRKNGVATTSSIFASDTPMIISTSATLVNGVYKVNGTLDSAHTSLANGDNLRVYVVQSGSAVDVSVCLEILY